MYQVYQLSAGTLKDLETNVNNVLRDMASKNYDVEDVKFYGNTAWIVYELKQ